MNCIKCRAPLPDGALYCPACGKKQAQESRRALRRPNGAGSVYKLSGRRRRPWVAAKNRVIIGYYERKTDALAALDKLSGRSLDERYNMTFAQAFEDWRGEHYREIGVKGVESYDRAFAVCAALHDRKMRDLRTPDYQAVIDANAGKAHSTLSKYKQLMTQMGRWAVREELTTTNFASFVKLPPAQRAEKETFSAAEIAALEADSSDAARVVLMLIYTGMRIGELFDLPVADWHQRYAIGGEKTEAGRNRVIPIRPEGRGYFADAAARATGELLLSGMDIQHTVANFRRRDYYPLLERLGIRRHTPHATRHTYASWGRDAGIPPEVLQKILGHASYSTTANIYVHSDTETLIQAVEGDRDLLVAQKR